MMRPPPPLEGPLQQPSLEPLYCSPPPPPPPPLVQEQRPPKILHSLLHNYNQLSHSQGHVHGHRDRDRDNHRDSHPQHHSAIYGMSPYGNAFPTPRARSGSLGSTGSSIRDSCSPGHDSTSSHETLSRGSPMSIGSSPSPSPPMTDSKLLGILRGSVAPQYAHLMYSVPKRTSTPTSPPIKRPLQSEEEQDEPIDLSCKSKKLKTVNNTADRSPSSATNSILEAVLCGKSPHAASGHQNWFCDRNDRNKGRGSTLMDSYLNNNNSNTNKNSSSSSSSMYSKSNLAPNQRVGLAKKTVAPVLARVQDWLVKIVQLAKLQPEFVRLPHSDKLTLILNAWARVLLLHMAENNFQFAVTSVHDHGSSTSPTNTSPTTSTNTSPVPTMADVEAIQNLISKCQSMNLDTNEYEYIRKLALFHSGYDGLENGDYVDDVNTYIRDDLQVHIRNSRPNEKLRYSNILLFMHTLFGINCKVVERLFCTPRGNGLPTSQLLRDLLQQP